MLIIPLAEEHLDAVTDLEEREGDVHGSRIQFEKELSNEVGRFFVMVGPVLAMFESAARGACGRVSSASYPIE